MNTKKYYNVFTIPLFSTMVDLSLIFYYLIFTYQKLTPMVLKTRLGAKLDLPPVLNFFQFWLVLGIFIGPN